MQSCLTYSQGSHNQIHFLVYTRSWTSQIVCHRFKYADRVQWFSYCLTKCWRQFVISVTLSIVQLLVYLFQTSERAPGTLVCTYQLWWDRQRENAPLLGKFREWQDSSKMAANKHIMTLQIRSAVMYRRIPRGIQLVKLWRGLTTEEKTVAASLFAEKLDTKSTDLTLQLALCQQYRMTVIKCFSGIH